MRVLSLLEVPVPPPSGTSQLGLPRFAMVVLALALAGGFFASVDGLVLGVVAAALVTLVVMYFLYPEMAVELVVWFFLLVFLPAGIMLLTRIHWSIPMFAVPVYAIVLFSHSPKIGAAFVGVMVVGAVVTEPADWFEPGSPFGLAIEKQQEAAVAAWGRVLGAPDAVAQLVSVELARATGTYYEGKVDQNARKTLGVQVRDPQVEDTVEGIPVRFFTEISAEPLDETITVGVACDVEGVAPDSYVPASELVFDAAGVQEVGCAYGAGALSAGPKTFRINATYGFRTLGYVVGSFGFSDRLQQLRRQGVDLFEEYGIVANPSAIYTNGPVKIGMGLGGTQPVPVYGDLEDRVFVLGATIDQSAGWATNGEISRIGNFYFIVPKEVTVTEVNVKNIPVVSVEVSCEALPVDEQQGCDGAMVRVYEVDMTVARSDLGFSDLYRFPVTVKAVSVIRRDDYDAFLGAGGLAQHLFRVAFDYDFTISKQRTFTVRAAPTSAGE